MADEDEIDILGDFNLPLGGESSLLEKTVLVSQNSDLLNCDYTIHPQWLLDKPSGNPDNWYNENSAPTTSDCSDSDGIGQISMENCITDESGWTDKEKNLLQRGLEIFGKSSVRLSQFVGSKSAAEVRYYLKNFFTGSLNRYRMPDSCSDDAPDIINSDVLNSDQIPASIEEVIAVKNARRKSSSGSSTASYCQTPLSPRPSPKKTKMNEKKKQQRAIKTKKKIRFKMNYNVTKKKLKSPQIKEPQRNSDVTPDSTISAVKSTSSTVSVGEEVVVIKREDDGESSDVSIDVEEIDDESHPKVTSAQVDPRPELDCKHLTEDHTNTQNNEDKLPVSDLVGEQLDSLEVPAVEVVLAQNAVTDLEKYIFSDFFEGRAAKTPERYLKIRNHIITNWNSSRPNYVYKTAMRVGLKNCGDVTCISRVHSFLEQIGAINFGCEQTKYERPLSRILHYFDVVKPRGRPPKIATTRELTELGPRQRSKKKFTNDGEGGCTMVHGDQGEIIDTTVVNEEPAKPRTYVKKPSIRLVYCRPFPPERPQEYSVSLTLSTLILMDFHSHSYLTEVMGLVGGCWDYQEGALKICCYEPCRNIASSTIHCDMCPISQAKAAENIYNKGFEILGWFHSHPTFAPEPSQQDLDTQMNVQQWIGHGKPCLGVILSPFSVNGALISSPFRCWLVDKKPNFEDQWVPYRLQVEVREDPFDISDLLGQMRSLLLGRVDEYGLQKDPKIPFDKPYFQDLSITHLEKFVSSVRMCLAKIGSLSKSKCDEILQEIEEVIKKCS